MNPRYWMLVAVLLLGVALLASPLQVSQAQTEADTSAQTEEEQNNIQGAGMLILGVGLVAILAIAGAYAPRRAQDSSN
jgi:Tfp pilus assembly protein PilV